MPKGLFLYILLCFAFPRSGIIAQDAFKNVVIFFGDNESRPAYSRIVDGIKSSFPEGNDFRINLISEFLDLERFPDSSHLLQVVDLYNHRLKASSIDLVITVAPGAYDALYNCGLELLHSVPVIAAEMSPKDPDRYFRDSRVVELQIEWSPKLSMEHAFALFPEKKHAYVIGGCSESDQMFSARLLQDAAYFKETHQFTFLSCVSIDSVLNVVRHLHDTSLIFLSSFTTDAENTPFSTSLALPIISGQSRGPVFTMSDNFIDYGGIGGNIISFTEVGKEAGRIARDLFAGDTLQGLTKIVKSYNRFQYNWEELAKWDLLDSKAIPPNSTFYRRKFDFFSVYRWQIIVVSLFIVFQAVLIYYLIRLAGKQKKVFAQKTQNEKLYRQLVREDRISLMAQLTASLSHELNQPLAAILFNAQAGLRFLASGKLDQQQAETILSDIVEDDKRAAEIISSVRNLMKMESRQKERVDLVAILKETLRILHVELEKQQIAVIFDEANVPAYTQGDRIQLQQVIMNLLLNAAQALGRNVSRPKQIWIELRRSDEQITIAIGDNGPGIDEAMRLKLFDSFVTSRKDGFGIGLAICKSIVQNHGGKILAENKPEGGAVFSFTLQAFVNGS